MYKNIVLSDVLEARNRTEKYYTRTPLHHYQSLDELIGAEIYVKHENHQKTGSFKVRGALNVLSRLSLEDKGRGVVAATSGNFGQGVAYAASVFDTVANIVVPVGANPSKVDSIRRLGANVIFHGEAFDDSREYAETLSQREGFRYIHSANENGLVAGVATYSLEIFEDLSDVDLIIVPVGGGSGACGACVISDEMRSGARVIGVQASSAPAAYLSWKEGKLIEANMDTAAEGLATRIGYDAPQKILRDHLSDFILVDEDEMRKAVTTLLDHTRNLAEHAGAAALAAAIKIKDRIRGKKVVLVMSGGNITVSQLKGILMDH